MRRGAEGTKPINMKKQVTAKKVDTNGKKLSVVDLHIILQLFSRFSYISSFISLINAFSYFSRFKSIGTSEDKQLGNYSY